MNEINFLTVFDAIVIDNEEVLAHKLPHCIISLIPPLSIDSNANIYPTANEYLNVQ